MEEAILDIRAAANALLALTSLYGRGGQPFEARVQQKEKSKLRGLHPGNTFITIKNTIYNTKSINVKLDAASAH